MAVVDLLTKEGSLTIDRRRISDIALAKNLGVGLSEILGPLDLSINFIYLLT